MLGASGISRNNKTSKLSTLDTRKGSNRELVEAVLIFARPAIATFDNIRIETQEWSTVTVSYPATERVERGGKPVSSVAPSIVAFTFSLPDGVKSP
jgi:hypothetical protein